MTKHTQDEIVAAHIRAAKITLEAVLGAGSGFAPMIVVERGDETVATITPPMGDGQTIYTFAQIAADSYLADGMILVIDTYATNDLTNPYTMQPWKRGEMEDLAVNHNGVQRGWVRDAIMLLFLTRGGAPAMFTLPYAVTPESRAVTWLDGEVTRKDGYTAGGMMTKVMEPTGMFEDDERPTDRQIKAFLIGLGAEVLEDNEAV